MPDQCNLFPTWVIQSVPSSSFWDAIVAGPHQAIQLKLLQDMDLLTL